MSKQKSLDTKQFGIGAFQFLLLSRRDYLKILFHTFFWGITLCFIVFLLWGCSSSSPRFSSVKKTKDKTTESKRRFASPIQEEVEKDDKKVDVGKIKSRFISTEKKNEDKSISSSKEKALDSPHKKKNHSEVNTAEFLQSKREKVMEEILIMLGVPYAYGGEDENGIDCSAFTRRIYNNALERNLPRTSEEQIREGEKVQKNSLHFGDLVFFNTNGTIPSHVGIFLEDDLFAHASESFGVTISSLQSSYYNSRYVGARRIFR